MQVLPKNKILDAISSNLKGWEYSEDGYIFRALKFDDFVEAFSFMTAIALEVEKLDHHPDWSNSYNKLEIKLTTHSIGGVSEVDLSLAEKINALYSKISG